MYKAYKYRLYPNKEQEQLILKHIGSCRFIYNYGLNKKVTAYQTDKTSISRFQIQSDLPILKKQEDTAWLKEVNSLSLQAALACLDNAFTRFFKEKKGFPKFNYNDEVKFNLDGEIKKGIVYVIDKYGTFEDDSDVSYDVLVANENERCLYKHINEKFLIT